jgi:hypothetical protein
MKLVYVCECCGRRRTIGGMRARWILLLTALCLAAYFPAKPSASSRRTTISLLIERRSACARFSIFS